MTSQRRKENWDKMERELDLQVLQPAEILDLPHAVHPAEPEAAAAPASIMERFKEMLLTDSQHGACKCK